jgi:hypothetical protein
MKKKKPEQANDSVSTDSTLASGQPTLGAAGATTPDRPYWDFALRAQGSPRPAGTSIIIPPQDSTVRTPYRPMSSPHNYAYSDGGYSTRIHLSDSLVAKGRIAPEVNPEGYAAATYNARFLSQADRTEGRITDALRAAKAQDFEDAGSPLSLADQSERAAQRARSRLSGDEVAQFSDDSIQQQNLLDQAMYDRQQERGGAFGVTTGRPWVGAHLKALADDKIARYNDTPVTPYPEVTGPGASTYSRLEWLAVNNADLYATVSQAVSQGTMDSIDVAKVTNLSLARQAAFEIANTPDQMRRDQLLAAQGNDAQRALVLAILLKSANAPREEPGAESNNLFVKLGKNGADWAMQSALPFLASASAVVVRGAMTAGNVLNADVVTDAPQPQLGDPGSLADSISEYWRDAWNMTAPGYYRPEDVTYLRDKYGQGNVDLLMEAIQLRNMGEGDVVGNLYEKYAQNPEALNILDGLFFSRTPTTDMQDLVQETAYLDMGNYGNWQLRGLAKMFGGEDAARGIWDDPGYSWMRDGFNVVSWVALDPFLIGGKVIKTAQYARLGLHHLAPGKIDNVFKKKSVRLYWDDLGNRLKGVSEIQNGVERRAALRRIANQEKRWFPPDVIQALYKAEVRSADDALNWFREMDNVKRVLMGQPARRQNQRLVPHAGAFQLTVARKNISQALRALDPTMRVAERWGQEFDEVAATADSMTATPILNGRAWSELSDEESAAALVAISNNPAAAEHLGTWMSDLTGDRTLAGRFWDAVRVGKASKARQYGFARRKSADRYLQFLSRTFATLPDMRAGIRIDDARDAQKVYQQARVAGFPRWFAVELSGLFAAAQPGQRRLMLSGLARTQAYVMGAHLIDPENGVENLVKVVTGYRPGETYAASMIPGAERKLREIVAEVRAEAESVMRAPTDSEAADDLAVLNDIYGQQAVNDAVDFDAAKAAREDLAGKVAELEKELADIDKQIEAVASKQDWELGDEFEAEVAALLDNTTAGIGLDPRGTVNVTDQMPLREVLDDFYIPEALAYKTSGMRWQKKSGGSSTARIRNQDTGEMVTYRVSQGDGGWKLEVEEFIPGQAGMRQQRVREIGVFQNKSAAQKQAQIEAGKVTQERVPLSTIDIDMLERGYLPVRWAEGMRDASTGNVGKYEIPETISPERQGRMFDDPYSTEDVIVNTDWVAVVESAGPVPGVKGKWVEIPWMRQLRQTARLNWEGQLDQGAEQVTRELDEARAALDGDDRLLAELRAAGIMDMDGLRASLPARTGRSEDEILATARDRWETWVRGQIPVSPSEGNAGQSAVFMGQLADRVFFPAVNQLEPYLARNTYLGTLLGRNSSVQTLTDIWVFATLAGPRFPLRNAFEDWIFWGLSAGAFVGQGSLRKGRRAAQGMRQARQIENKRIVAARQAVDDARLALENARGTKAVNEVRDLESELKQATDRLAAMEKRGKAVRTEKLGLFKTAMRRVGTALMRFDNTVEPEESMFRAIVHPYLSDEEVTAANIAYRDGSRQELADLIATAAIRERVLFMPPGRGVSQKLRNWVLARNGDRSVLSMEDQKMLEEIEQFAKGRNGFEQLDSVSEESRNMMDGNLPTWQDSPDFVFAGDTPLQRVFINTKYVTAEAGAGQPSKKAVDSVWQTLVMALHGDGPKSQAAMYRLPEWFRADAVERSDIIDDVARQIILADQEVGYLGRFSLVNAAGDVDEAAVRGLAERTLMTLEGAFTTREGAFNQTLWDRLHIVQRGSDGGKLHTFKVWKDEPSGALRLDGSEEITRNYNVNKSDFIKGDVEMPRTFLTFDGTPVVTMADSRAGWGWWQNISNPAWDAMGRSLARMTREPMFLANYLDARAALRPFEAEWRRLYGDEWWKVADEIASDNAYNITLSYVDNPAVRSQLAWQVRNVARFWRATEDFYRRSYRLVKNNPMGVYKAAWAINHLRDAGWVEWDENGEPYFIYPGTKPMFDSMNIFMNFIGFRADIGLGSGNLPLMATGRVTGLTPSADPDAVFPSMTGWYASLPVRALLRAAPSLDKYLSPYTNARVGDAANVAEATLFGDMAAESRDWTGDMWPTHLKRLWTIIDASRMGSQETLDATSGAFADAVRMAITANVRAGLIADNVEITNENRDEILRRIDATATDIIVLKFLAGAFFPASPSFKPDDVSDIAREFGVYSLKPEYYELRERLGTEAAQMLWFERHPDEAPYTVSSATSSEYDGFWQATSETEEWIRTNRSLVDAYPLGASIIAPPQDRAMFNQNTYNFMQRQGLIQKGTVGNFLLKSANAETWLEYQSLMSEYEAGVKYANATISDPNVLKETLSQLDERLTSARQVLYLKDPALEERIMAGEWGMSSQAIASEMTNAVSIALPLAQGAQVPRLNDMRVVLDKYEEAKTRLDSIPQQTKLTEDYENFEELLRDRWKNFVLDWYGKYREDQGFVKMLRTTSDALGFQIGELR